ncbi:MAG: hypothetical protein LBJ75_02305 [Puniceicoccales bacterium]|nr:hypothetical protein [Puniceicoccales bacterium]
MSNATDIVQSITNIWNSNIIPALQGASTIGRSVAVQNATTLREVVEQASGLKVPLAKLLMGRAADFTRPAFSLIAAHPAMAAVLAVVVVVIPVLREYFAEGGKFTLTMIPVVAWKIITRPFRLAYRILTVITGGTVVDRQELIAARKTIAQVKESNDVYRRELQVKQQAVTAAINLVANADTKAALRVATNRLFNAANVAAPAPAPGGGGGAAGAVGGVVANNFFEQHAIDWNFLQSLVGGDPQLQAVKNALDDWKKHLDLYIKTQ